MAQNILSTDPTAGEILSTDPSAGEPITAAAQGTIPQPPAATRPARMGGPPQAASAAPATRGGRGQPTPQVVRQGKAPEGRGFTGFMQDNLPLIGAGILGGITGGAGLPLALAGAGTGAFAGKSGSNLWRAMDDDPRGDETLPTTKTESLMQSGEAALTEGVIPELIGRGGATALGFVSRRAGNLIARRGAAKRNESFVQQTVNPQGLKLSPGAGEVGKQEQVFIDQNKQAVKEPLDEAYDRLWAGEFGQARENITLPQAPHAEAFSASSRGGRIDYAPPSMQGGVQVSGQKGPTIHQLHQRRSENLTAGRRAVKAADPEITAKGRAAIQSAGEDLAKIEQIATENGLSMDQYRRLESAWRNMRETYDNDFIRSLKKMTGNNMIVTLTKPETWRTFKVSRPSGQRVTLDQPDLVRVLREAVGDEDAWAALQTAVQHRIIRQSSNMGKINPTVLSKRIQDMTDNGARDLIPASKELNEIAKILEEGTYDPKLPYLNNITAVINWAMTRSGLAEPDVMRILAQMQGHKGFGERLARAIGRLIPYGARAGMNSAPAQDRSNPFAAELGIPEPPGGQ